MIQQQSHRQTDSSMELLIAHGFHDACKCLSETIEKMQAAEADQILHKMHSFNVCRSNSERKDQ